MEVKITNNADKFRDALPKQIEQALIAIGIAAESNAKKEITKVVYDTPERGYVRTGRLRNSISHTHDNDSVYIGTNVEYGKYVELGTTRMKKRPFLAPAATQHSEEYKNIAKQALKGE